MRRLWRRRRVKMIRKESLAVAICNRESEKFIQELSGILKNEYPVEMTFMFTGERRYVRSVGIEVVEDAEDAAIALGTGEIIPFHDIIDIGVDWDHLDS